MGDSIRLRIVNAAKTALEVASVTVHPGTADERTVTKPTGLTFHRFRTRPVEADSLPVGLLAILSEPQPSDDATGLYRRRVRLGIEYAVKVAAGTPPDDDMDPLVTWGTIALMDDETLGGVALMIDELGTAWAPHERDVTIMTAQVVYEIHYQTRRNDPELAA